MSNKITYLLADLGTLKKEQQALRENYENAVKILQKKRKEKLMSLYSLCHERGGFEQTAEANSMIF